MGSTNNTGWGEMSLVAKDQNPYMRRHNVLSWVLEDKSKTEFTLIPTSFPPVIVNVLDTILLRDALTKGVKAIEVTQNLGIFPDNPISVSVLHVGDIMPMSDSGNGLLVSLTEMVESFPPSYYEIEVNDATDALTYKQVFTEKSGALVREQPITSPSEDSSSWTKVTFKPDVDIFSIPYDGHVIGQYLWKRCIDIVATLNIKVQNFGAFLKPQTFDQYVDGWYPRFTLEKRSDAPNRLHEKAAMYGHNWEVSIGRSHGKFEQISFVNGFSTPKGGTHVKLVEATLRFYAQEVEKKHSLVVDMDDLSVFVSLIVPEKPAFSSEKDCFLTEFAGDYKLKFSDDFTDKFYNILSGLGPIALRGTIPNLVDATEAGGELSGKCCLILTEGESAAKFAQAGHGSIGKELYGVLSLGGKIPNAKRNESKSYEHAEVASIITSLGLEKGAFYNSAKNLRYGHLMLMMDQDHDGSHIKGLIINLLHTFWPSLLKIDFLWQFITPVVKVKVKASDEVLAFFSIPEYNIWAKERHETSGSTDWTTRYFKGLASHDSDEAVEYMSMDMDRLLKKFYFSGPQDFNAIELAFSENRKHDRRQWIMAFEEGTFLDLTPKRITFSDFFNKEFLLYSVEDIKRSIPSMVDGLKPSQRKALFTALKTKKNLESDKINVENFAGDVCNECAYHHGQVIMSNTIIGMAQNYVGTNNINLFVPKGIFGSRREGPKSDARYLARYLAILMSPMTRCIFMKEDDAILSLRVEDGKEVQPDWLLPVIPMVLVNGCEGIGTGWSTKIMKYHPVQVIQNLERLLTGEETEPFVPWFKGFNGHFHMQEGSESSYLVSGIATSPEPGKIVISELPLETNIGKYKACLDSLIGSGEIVSYDENHRGDDFEFVVVCTDKQFQKAQETGFIKYLKLFGSVSTNNMHLIDEKGLITKYSSPDEILNNFRDFRLPFYEKRKIMMSEQFVEDLKKKENIKRYLQEYNVGKFSRDLWLFKQQLETGGYALPGDPSFRYLLDLPMSYLLLAGDIIPTLDAECKSIKDSLVKLEGKSAIDLWKADLQDLKQKITLFYEGAITEDPEFRSRKRRRTEP